jgi:transposase-like protein
MSKKGKSSVNLGAESNSTSTPPSLPGARDGSDTKERRFSAQKKAQAAQRLLRGEAIDVLSRELGVTAATLSGWRDKFLAAGEAALKSREPTAQDDEILRLKAMIGDLAMRNELLAEKGRLLEANHPSFPWRRSRG